MSTGALSDLDVRAREHVVHQLDWDPEVDASGIGVSARNGVVTLTGFIDTYGGKLAAERAFASAPGITRVDNEIRVEPTDEVDEIC